MEKQLLSVSLVMYCNDVDELTTAIKSSLRSNLVGKVYLIDNSPTDSLKILNQLDLERVVYLFQNNNLGFGKAHNIGIAKSINEGFDYHLILNPDIEFETGVLEELSNYLSFHPNCGMITPKIFYKNGDLQYLCKKIPNAFEMFGKRLPFNFLQKKICRTKKIFS